MNSEYSCACALACRLLLIFDCSWAMADAVVDAEADEEGTTVARPLPMGLAEAGLLVAVLGVSDGAVCSKGDAVMFARAGGCPIGVIERPEPTVPTGAILLGLVVLVLTGGFGGATTGMKLEVVFMGAWIAAGSC